MTRWYDFPESLEGYTNVGVLFYANFYATNTIFYATNTIFNGKVLQGGDSAVCPNFFEYFPNLEGQFLSRLLRQC